MKALYQLIRGLDAIEPELTDHDRFRAYACLVQALMDVASAAADPGFVDADMDRDCRVLKSALLSGGDDQAAMTYLRLISRPALRCFGRVKVDSETLRDLCKVQAARAAFFESAAPGADYLISQLPSDSREEISGYRQALHDAILDRAARLQVLQRHCDRAALNLEAKTRAHELEEIYAGLDLPDLTSMEDEIAIINAHEILYEQD